MGVHLLLTFQTLCNFLPPNCLNVAMNLNDKSPFHDPFYDSEAILRICHQNTRMLPRAARSQRSAAMFQLVAAPMTRHFRRSSNAGGRVAWEQLIWKSGAISDWLLFSLLSSLLDWTTGEWVTSSKTHPVTTANRHIGENVARCHNGDFFIARAVTTAIF